MEFYDLLLLEEPGKLRMDGKEYTWNTWGEILKPGKDSQVWATYTQEFYEGKPAVTTRKLGKGTVTYVGVDSTDGLLEKDILKKLCAIEYSCDGFTIRCYFRVPQWYGDCTELYR